MSIAAGRLVSVVVCATVAVLVAGSAAEAATSGALNPAPGTTIFASGGPDLYTLIEGNGSRSGFGADWSGLIPTWEANPAADQRFNAGSIDYGLTGDPTINYRSSDFGAPAFNEFGDAAGHADETEDGYAYLQDPPILDGFIATDEPASTPQIGWARAASNGTAEEDFPIAQTPVVLLFSLPPAISLATDSRLPLINNASGDASSTLQAIFDGNVGPADGYPANTWGALLSRAGFKVIHSGRPTATEFLDTGLAKYDTGGFRPLRLDVRSGNATETNVLQTFLSMSGDRHFSSPSYGEQNWPSYANDGSQDGRDPSGAYTTGSSLVISMLDTPGTIGYATLGDAVYGGAAGASFMSTPQTTTYGPTAAHQYLFASVQTDEGSTGTRHYAEPGTVTPNPSGSLEAVPNLYVGASSNSDGCSYPLDADHDYYGVGNWCDTIADGSQEWAGTASDPRVYVHSGPPGSGVQPVDVYPIVEVAYATAWSDYGANLPTNGFYNSASATIDTGNTVRAFLDWLTKPSGGASAITSSKLGWEQLPTFIQSVAHTYADDIAVSDVDDR